MLQRGVKPSVTINLLWCCMMPFSGVALHDQAPFGVGSYNLQSFDKCPAMVHKNILSTGYKIMAYCLFQNYYTRHRFKK